eukprot:gene12766-14077_t
MDADSWDFWFCFLMAALLLVCIIAAVYGCCCPCPCPDASRPFSSCNCGPCVSSCCCNRNEYTLQITHDDDHRHVAPRRSRTSEFLDELIADLSQNTSNSSNSSEEDASRSVSPVLSHSAQAARVKRLLPVCTVFKFNTKRTILVFRRSRKCKNDVCPICLDQYSDGDSLVLCPCKHAYHLKCLEGWLKVKGCCPLCKRPIRNELTTERTPLLYQFI